MASIRLENVQKRYDGGRAAVAGVDLEVADGEFFVLVGPSGCGKSTLLRMLAGLELPTGGTIRLGGVDVTGLEPRQRDIAMVFQNYAIYPHMSVRKNVGYGLRVRGMPKREIDARVREVAELLALEPLLDRKPATLSGGQLQRVAMGRAIARKPQVYLMDEPLSNLDAKLRVTMRAELERLHHELGVTTVYVTHDQVEAMTLGQRAAVLRAGEVQQVATPQELYARPANAFVAAFIGSPPMNFAIGAMRDGVLSFGGVEVALPERVRPPVGEGERVLVGIRPEDLRDPRGAAADNVTVEVDCVVHQDLGADVLLFFSAPADAGDTDAIARVTFSDEGTRATGEARMLCARVGADYPVRGGERARLSLAPERIAYFDLETGVRL